MSEDLTYRQKLVNGLNKALSREYSAALQYTQHYGVVTGAQWMPIRGALSEHAKEEQGHALTLSDLVQFCGGVPTLEVKPEPETAEKAEALLEQDLEGEAAAIQEYRDLVKMAQDGGYYEVVEVLLGILKDELDHANELMLALGK